MQFLFTQKCASFSDVEGADDVEVAKRGQIINSGAGNL